MRSRHLVAAAVLTVTAVLGAAFAVAVLHRPGEPSVRLGARPVVVASRTLSPAEPQFGDTVVASLEVLVDPRRVDPGSVRVQADFTPFSVESSSRSVVAQGGVSAIRLTDRLACLDARCVPKGDAATFRLPRLRLTYPQGSLAAAWPPVRVHARVLPADLRRPLLRVAQPHAHPSYRLPPGATGWTLVALSVAAALGGLALLVRAAAAMLPPRRRAPVGLEHILEELTSRTNGDGAHRRDALERLARELEALDGPLSFESRVLAWAPQDPPPDVVSDLAQRVRTAVRR